MLFDDSRETILNNLCQYAKHGCTPYCTQFEHITEFETFIKPDCQELEYMYKRQGKNCVTAFYDNNVNSSLSGLTRRVHNGNLIKHISKKLGNKTQRFIQNVGLKDINLLSSIMYGTTYDPLIRNFGKGTQGLCLTQNTDCLLLYTSNISPLTTLQNFYHEVAHAMSHKLGLEKQEKKSLALLEKRAILASPENQENAKQICKNEQQYLNYISESYAEVFGTMMTLLRTQTEVEFQTASQSLLQHFAARMYFSLNGNTEDATYNAYKAIKNSINMLNELGRRGRAKFAQEKGYLDFNTVAKTAFEITKQHALTRTEFQTYSNYNGTINMLHNLQGVSGYSWARDALEATNIVIENADKLNLLSLANKVASAKSQRQIYDAFHNFSNVVPEAQDIYDIYTNNNPKAQLYKKLRRTQEILGVDQLLGAIAKKRRALGAKIMQHISGGRN